MTKIDIAKLDHNLANDVRGEDLSGYELHEIAYDGATVSNQHWQVLWYPADSRAGVAFCGSGSSGATYWTDADNVEDAVRRVREDDLRP